MTAERRRWRAPWVVVVLALHVAALVVLISRSDSWPLVVTLLVLSHALLVWGGVMPRSSLLGPNITRLDSVAAGRDVVALTFDDGPDPEVTPRVLHLLEQAGASASFFCLGAKAERWPELVQEIVRRGHRVENHTFHHPNAFSFYPPWLMARELDRTQEVLERLSGRRPRYFRAPAGIRNPWLEPLLARRGLALVSWTRRGFDTVASGPEQVVARLLAGLAAGDILLLHDRRTSRGGDREPPVLEALRQLLEALAAAGLEAVHLPDSHEPASNPSSRS